MHPKTFALLLMLVTVGCVRPGNGTADTLSSPATTFTDTVKVDSTEKAALTRIAASCPNVTLTVRKA